MFNYTRDRFPGHAQAAGACPWLRCRLWEVKMKCRRNNFILSLLEPKLFFVLRIMLHIFETYRFRWTRLSKKNDESQSDALKPNNFMSLTKFNRFRNDSIWPHNLIGIKQNCGSFIQQKMINGFLLHVEWGKLCIAICSRSMMFHFEVHEYCINCSMHIFPWAKITIKSVKFFLCHYFFYF